MYLTTKLRRNQTLWERKLWNAIRAKKLGKKFRRQVKVGNYIVDFICLSKKIIIELDGGHHNEKEISLYDQERQRKIEAMGYTVLRFWNNEVDQNIEGVIEEIYKYV